MKYVVTDEDVAKWAERHDLHFGSKTDAYCAFEDAVSFGLTLGELVAVPDGHKIVPLLPTAEMLDAAADACIGFSGDDEVDAVWIAMLSAAPHHPTTEKGCE